jgi:hypothetical protein
MEITFAASILLPDDEMYDFWDGLQLEWCRADAPAEAILAAYIAALEAERGAGDDRPREGGAPPGAAGADHPIPRLAVEV